MISITTIARYEVNKKTVHYMDWDRNRFTLCGRRTRGEAYSWFLEIAIPTCTHCMKALDGRIKKELEESTKISSQVAG